MINNPFSRLLSINRFSNRTLTRPDTDAEHTIRMQLMALYLYNKAPVFDIKEVCFKILCHDLEECWMCDIPRPVKYHDKSIFEELQRVQNELIAKDDINDLIKRYMDSAKDDTPEGWIVRFLDVYDAYSTLKKEAWTQHSDELFEDSAWSFKLLKEIKETIVRERKLPKRVAGAIGSLCDSDEKFNFKVRSV